MFFCLNYWSQWWHVRGHLYFHLYIFSLFSGLLIPMLDIELPSQNAISLFPLPCASPIFRKCPWCWALEGSSSFHLPSYPQPCSESAHGIEHGVGYGWGWACPNPILRKCPWYSAWGHSSSSGWPSCPCWAAPPTCWVYIIYDIHSQYINININIIIMRHGYYHCHHQHNHNHNQ